MRHQEPHLRVVREPRRFPHREAFAWPVSARCIVFTTAEMHHRAGIAILLVLGTVGTCSVPCCHEDNMLIGSVVLENDGLIPYQQRSNTIRCQMKCISPLQDHVSS